jgi:hypothetical protein
MISCEINASSEIENKAEFCNGAIFQSYESHQAIGIGSGPNVLFSFTP